MSQIDVQNDYSMMNSSETDEWSKETIKRMSGIRRLLRYVLIGTGSLTALFAALMATGYIYFNSKMYERTTYTQDDWERLRWRAEWVKNGMEDPCRHSIFEIDYEKWKCDEEDLSDSSLKEDIFEHTES